MNDCFNDAPVAVDDTATTPVGTDVIIDLLGNDYDPNGDPFQLYGVPSATNGWVEVNPDGTITYHPDPGYEGPVTITYTIIDTHGATDVGECLVMVGDDTQPDGIVQGTAGDDLIDVNYTGDPHGDMVDNNDEILPGEGPNDDIIMAGDGDDTVLAGEGDDDVYGGSGDDVLAGEAGDDILRGEDGDDSFVLANGFGNDSITGGESGETDGDTLDATAVSDDTTVILSDPETGTISDGTDTAAFAEIENINLGSGDDLVIGSAGDDNIDLGEGSDIVDGGEGDDTIGLGRDPDGTPDGDPDVVVFSDGDGNDTILDFDAPVTDPNTGEVTGIDTLDVSGMTDENGDPVDTDDVTVTDDGNGNAVLTFPNGESLVLEGVAPEEVDSQEELHAIGIPLPAENSDPVAVDDTATTDEDTPVTIDVLANDTDPDGDDLSILGVPTADNGTVTVNPDGTLEYTPDPDFNGEDIITYEISDGNGGTDTGQVVVTVNPVNDDPVANDDTGTTGLNTPVVIDVLDNDTDVDGDVLEVLGTPTSADGTVVVNPDGTITFTPNDGFVGEAVINYDITDGNGGTDSAIVTVTVADTRDGIVEGTAGDDIIDINYTGDPDGDMVDHNDEILPGEGPNDDIILAGDGNDTVLAGEGDDEIDGGSGDDIIFGDVGDDEITGGDGSDIVDGGDGDDVIDTSGSAPASDYGTPDGGAPDADPYDDRDTVFGGAGDDIITTGDDQDTIEGGSGDDIIDGGLDDDTIDGGEGDDIIIGGHGSDTVMGGDGDDVIDTSGTDPASDYGWPLGGIPADTMPDDDRDVVDGGAGDDTITTGDDQDVIEGGSGDDFIDGGLDDDTIDGGADDDFIIGGHGSDTITGGSGDDEIWGGMGPGTDPFNIPDVDQPGDGFPFPDPVPDNGMDVIHGGDGNDTIYGQDDDDQLFGGQGDDVVDGGIDDDLIDGGAGDDTLLGGQGDDVVIGGSGDDAIDGGTGDDILSGGDDRDTFTNVNAGDEVDGGAGGDDYDVLDLTGSAPVGGSLEVTVTGPDSNGNGVDGYVTYFDGDGNITGTLNFEEIEEIIPCFTPGTMIATPKGERRVEELCEGDKVITRDNGIQEIRWIGAKKMGWKELAANEHLKPVLIQAGALGNGLPERDILVSPNHRVLVANDRTALYFEEREVLVAAKHLVDNRGVQKVDTMGTTYIHFMFDHHEVVLSNGAWTESFQPGDYSLKGIGNAQRTEILELFPELEKAEGIEGYAAARRTLKKHEAKILLK